jgi:adiponectin receptor
MVKDARAAQRTARHEDKSQKGLEDAGKDNEYWPRIAHRDEIPKWLRDNDYILTGHPMPTHSYKKSYRLWRCLHMETMNIWTHLFGSAAFVATGIGLMSYSRSMHADFCDVMAIGASVASAAVCFGLSATFHTLRSHSYDVHHFWGTMDILGICILAFGGGTSITYYAFYGQPIIQRTYWTLSIVSSAAAAVTLFDTGGGGSKLRTLRGSVFSLLVLSATLPIFHCIYNIGWTQAQTQIGAQWFLAEAIALLVAVSAFVGRIPERFSPGSFDIWGHSHQIFHSLAVIGTAFHLKALLTAYAFRHNVS